MDVRITKLDGSTFTLAERGYNATDFVVSSAPIAPIYDNVEGRAGTIDYGATYGGQRGISVPFYFEAMSQPDFAEMRDDLFELVGGLDPFYVEELRRYPDEFRTTGQVVGGKRYKVRLSGEVDVAQQTRVGKGELTFETVDLPYAESEHTTLDGLAGTLAWWPYRRHPDVSASDLVYEHTGVSTFRIYNGGNVAVSPYEQYEPKITISDVTGSTSYFELANLTNGTRFRVTKGVTNAQVIALDGPEVTSNGLQFFRETTHQLIELSPGWNEFVIRGADSATVAMDFKFYYI